ncbi:Flp pilus assembly complex ATPase component TadA [Clostridium sp. PL3]|uniref:Flp pilus assembly complex ATPase component TadA n=1 Tax=Clostridium thailandense TaxID=2794346 RepID=A0A949X643_9CLOT|nr:sigma 54-interacting transcriptional regulator [Clostridium thailandense]MBV7276738.1 Flp pilus assembly complex ATPase component TadA [Clostridium thailandense]
MENNDNVYDQLMKYALKSMYFTIITDDKGIILFVSENYEKLLGLGDESILGLPIEDVIENSGIPRVIQIKKEEIGHLFTLKDGKTVVCNRIPIFHEEKFYGVISTATFYNLNEVDKLNQEIIELKKENMSYRKKIMELSIKQKFSIDQVIGKSKPIMDIKATIQKFASSNLTFLITGDTGTGKEVFANAIHQLSDRQDKNFVKINCAAIPKDLLESELFGYEPGAFSGALKNGKVGKFELANYGTILLDEIGEMPLSLQSKLLRVLQERELERVGGLKTIKLDVRVICSTNQNIEDQVAQGLFRKDLFYRINVVELKIPPLKDRLDDILPLSNYFINKINNSFGLGVTCIKKDVLSLFNEYQWTGNVRELEHVLERACIMAGSGPLKIEYFDFLLPRIYKNDHSSEESINNENSLTELTSKVEKEKIIKALIEVKGNKSAAAKLLDIDRGSLYNKLKKYGIDI